MTFLAMTKLCVCNSDMTLYVKSEGFIIYIYITICISGLTCDSVGKESACNAGYLGSIPGLGRSPR